MGWEEREFPERRTGRYEFVSNGGWQTLCGAWLSDIEVSGGASLVFFQGCDSRDLSFRQKLAPAHVTFFVFRPAYFLIVAGAIREEARHLNPHLPHLQPFPSRWAPILISPTAK